MIGTGVSDTLLGVFQGLKDTYGVNGQKYREEDIDRLAGYIVCRNYGSACLELCHLCWAVVQYSHHDGPGPRSKLLNYFWVDENIDARNVRQFFATPWHSTHQKKSIALTENTLDLTLGASLFQISPTRVSLLAALLEFITTIDPGLLNEIEVAFTDANTSPDTELTAIKSMASHLQKLLYRYLSEHLPAAQEQNKFRVIFNWVNAHSSKETLSDEDILQFWLDNSIACEVEGFVKYSSVADEMLLWLIASYAAEHHYSASHALVIDSQESELHISPDKLHQSLFQQNENDKCLDVLTGVPKCATQAQLNLLLDLDKFARFGPRFMRTLFRYRSFGQWQSVLIQASRKSQEQVVDKLNAGCPANYLDLIAQLRDLPLDLKTPLFCLFHVLYEQSSAICLTLLHNLVDDDFCADVQCWLEAQVDEDGMSEITREQRDNVVRDILQKLSVHFPEFKALINTGAKAFRSNNKAGFKTMPELVLQDDYIQAAESLMLAIDLANSSIERIIETESQLSSNFSSDLSIFKARLNKLHGGGYEQQ